MNKLKGIPVTNHFKGVTIDVYNADEVDAYLAKQKDELDEANRLLENMLLDSNRREHRMEASAYIQAIRGGSDE